MNSNKITNLASATSAADALSRTAGDARFYLATLPLNSITAPTDSLDLNSQKITSLATPSNSSDMASKDYVDTQISTYDGSVQLLVNGTNADSKLTAAQTELTNNNTPLNMNS